MLIKFLFLADMDQKDMERMYVDIHFDKDGLPGVCPYGCAHRRSASGRSRLLLVSFFFFCLFLAGVGGKVLFVRNVGIPVVPLWGCGWSFVTRTFELGGPGTSPGIRIDLKSLSRL